MAGKWGRVINVNNKDGSNVWSPSQFIMCQHSGYKKERLGRHPEHVNVKGNHRRFLLASRASDHSSEAFALTVWPSPRFPTSARKEVGEIYGVYSC